MTRFAIQRVKGTDEALELIEQLVERHGPVAFFQSDEGRAKCLTRAELLPGDGDLKLGEVGGAPFYVDVERYELSGRPALVLDVAQGAAGRFSLEGLEEVHFVTRAVDPAPVAG
jgi:uncharacterized protein